MLLVAGFGHLAHSYVRNIPFLALVAYGPGAAALTRAGANAAASVRWAEAAATACAATALFIASPTWARGRPPGEAPARTADFVQEFHPRGRIVNALHSGGYLAWRLFPAYMVAADGRTYYGANAGMRFSEGVLEARDGWREAARAQGATMIATPGFRPSMGALLPIVAELDSDPDWALIVTEPAGMLLVRRDAFPRGAMEIPSRTSGSRSWPRPPTSWSSSRRRTWRRRSSLACSRLASEVTREFRPPSKKCRAAAEACSDGRAPRPLSKAVYGGNWGLQMTSPPWLR